MDPAHILNERWGTTLICAPTEKYQWGKKQLWISELTYNTHTQKTGDPLEGFLLWWKQSKVYWSRKRTRTEENNYVAEYFRQECSWEARKMQSSFVVAAEFKIINSETEVGGKLFHLPKHHKWPPQPPDLATAPSIFEPRIFQHYWGKPSFSHNCKPSLQRQPPSVRVHVYTHTHTSHMHA